MFKFALFALLISSAVATYGNYNSRGYSGSYGRGSSGLVIPLAVHSRRSIAYYDVPSTYDYSEPLTIEVPPSTQPLNFLMRSRSSPISISAVHQPGRGSYQETSSRDEPHVRVHTVYRPVVQEVRELITPYRAIRQEIQPVIEEVERSVARGGGQGYSGSSSSKSNNYRGSSYRRY